MATFDPMLSEFREEAATTRRVLERVPEAKLAWKPHTKSMSLGQLAWHVASVPGNVAQITQQESFDVTQGNFQPPQPKSVGEILSAHEDSVKNVENVLQSLTDQKAREKWRVMNKDRELFARPRIEAYEIDHAESLVSPPRPTGGLPAIVGCSGAGDLRPFGG